MNNYQPTENRMPQAISYIRFSARTQEKGTSIERQIAMRKQWLEDNPQFTLSKLSEQDIAKSASKGDHLKHGLGRILLAIEQGLIKEGDYIIVEAIDRLGRLSQVDMLDMINNIVKSGVSIVTLEDNQTYSLESINHNGSSIFILVGKIQQAHDYSQALSRRISAAYTRKREQAKKGKKIALNTPIWLTSNGELIPKEASMVKECINLYLKGYGLRRIIRQAGDKYPHLETIGERTLKRWFNNPALVGQWKNKGDPIDGVFEPLISLEKYYELRRELKHRSKSMSPEQTYSLSGLVFCHQCESRFYFRRKLYNEEYIIYANCSTYLKKGKAVCSNNTTWPYQVLEYFLRTTYGEHLKEASLQQVSNEATQELKSLIGQKEDNKARMDTTTKLLIEYPENPSIKEQFAELDKKDQSLRTQIAIFEERLETQNPSLLTAKLMKEDHKFKLEAALDSTYLRDILHKVGYQIRVNGKTLSIKYTYKDATDGPIDTLVKLTLLRRSTAHKCYVAEDVTHYKWGNKNQHNKKVTTFLAINKYGSYLEAETEKELISQLLDRPNFSDAPDIQSATEQTITTETLRRLNDIQGTGNMTTEEFIDEFYSEVIQP